jgi:hemerythrin superfamily protein
MAEAPRTELDALEMLMQDHRELESLFREYESLQEDDEERAGELITAACAELAICATLEIEIFYPAVHEATETEEIKDLLDDGEDRHDAMHALIEKLGDAADYAKRDRQFAVISGHAQRHIDEEEAKLYPKVKKVKKLDLVAVGNEMKVRKSALMPELGLTEEEAA